MSSKIIFREWFFAALFVATVATSVVASPVVVTPGASAGYLYFAPGTSETSGPGGSGGAATGCYVGMTLPTDVVATPMPCVPGDPIYADGTRKTIVGKYVGITASGKHMVAAAADSLDMAWCTVTTQIANYATSVISGESNTNEILAKCTGDGAAKICRAMGPKWFLPSRDEIFYFNTHKQAIGGFNNKNYWVSTRRAFMDHIIYNVTTGVSSKEISESSSHGVRCAMNL